MLSDLLREPLLRNVDIDSDNRIKVHRKILDQKPLMKEVCQELYAHCAKLDSSFFSCDGSRIELGAGVSYIKDFFPDVSVTDIVPAEHLDFVLDAQNMAAIPDGSVRAFFGIHCFHHFPEPKKFFSELDRTLASGGGCVLIEPYFGLMSRLLYPLLFKSEDFNMNQACWETPNAGAMSRANQALSYVVLFRDRDKFTHEFPNLKIIHTEQLQNYPRYLLSGGLNFRSLIPASFSPLLKCIERLLAPMSSLLALHHTIVIKRI